MEKEHILLLFLILLVVIMGFIFTADDATGLGELLDPAEFMFMAIIGYFGKKLVDD